jgi:hypothetical protein
VGVNLEFLIAKLNDTCRAAMEATAAPCASRTNYEVDIEHLLISLLTVANCDLHRILAYFEIDASRLAQGPRPCHGPAEARKHSRAHALTAHHQGPDRRLDHYIHRSRRRTHPLRPRCSPPCWRART